jgi:hypothetical protein
MTNQQISPPPRDFLCPITREIMQNPVLLIEDVNFIFEKKNELINSLMFNMNIGSFI